MEANVNVQAETDWDLIPSDPDIFNDMLREYGINQMSIKEAYSVTFEEFMNNSPVYGVIYTSHYEEEQLPDNIKEEEVNANNIVFTSQIVTNACATLALLAIVLNVDIERGEILNEFKNLTENFTPINRGIAIGNSPQIKKIHNAYEVAEKRAYEEMINEALQSTNGTESLVDEDSFHCISYIVKNGFIWELDGIKPRPIKLAAVVEEQHWLSTLSPYLQHKMEDDIQCSILVATTNPLTDLKKSLEEHTDELQKIKDKLKEANDNDNATETMNESLLLQQQQQHQDDEEKNMLVDVESKKRKSNREDEEENEVQENKSDDGYQPLNKKQKQKQNASVEGEKMFKNTLITITTHLLSEDVPSSSSNIMHSNEQQLMKKKSSSLPLSVIIPENNIMNNISPVSLSSDSLSPVINDDAFPSSSSLPSPLSPSYQHTSSLNKCKDQITNVTDGLKCDIKRMETEVERDILKMSHQKSDNSSVNANHALIRSPPSPSSPPKSKSITKRLKTTTKKQKATAKKQKVTKKIKKDTKQIPKDTKNIQKNTTKTQKTATTKKKTSKK